MQSLPPEVREAKFVGLAALRAEMYDRNLQVGQLCTPLPVPAEARRSSVYALLTARRYLTAGLRFFACAELLSLLSLVTNSVLPLLPPCPALQVLQRMLGERYMYHKKTAKGDDPSAYRPYYIDMSEWDRQKELI